MDSTEPLALNEIKGHIPRSHVTIYDVADRACVSPATVSRILAGFVVYKPETKQRVLATAQAMGYVPNPQAKKLALMRAARASWGY